MDSPVPGTRFGYLARVGVFALIAILGLTIIPVLMMPVFDYFLTAAMGTFAAAAIANTISVRIFERGQLVDIGLGWSRASRRHLAFGFVGGLAAALLASLLPLAAGEAHYETVGTGQVQWRSVFFISIILLFGAVGEEMLFRGYAFQVLTRSIGPAATVLPMAVLFGLAHLNNQNVSWIGVGNTVAWGALFGVAFLRSGDLWLPIGLHFGWNWVLPLVGVNLSGFKMEVTGHSLQSSWNVLWSGGAYGPEGGLLTTLVVAALFYYIYRIPIERQDAMLLREPVAEEVADEN
jgi:membrane protease YdiL (CAAX protease family)